MPSIRLLLFVGSVLVLLGSPDRTKAEPYRFQTPLRNIFCQIDSRGIACDLITIPGPNGQSSCKQTDCNELRFFLPPTGKAFAVPRSDSMAFVAKNKISSGTKLKAISITCIIFNDSISCNNFSDGSLVLRRLGYDLNIGPHH